MSRVEVCAKLIEDAKNIVVLSGAGMSTESGIPDFRSSNGLYSKTFRGLEPESILSLSFFKNNPELFWEFVKTSMDFTSILPNVGHKILSKWESQGKYINIITQNIDHLHTLSGSTRVIEIHGTMQTASCSNPTCKKHYKFNEIISNKNGHICTCGCYIKPDVILYEEYVNELSKVYPLMAESDLLIILGTSLTVYPVAGIPDLFDIDKKHIIIINKTPTRYENCKNCIEIHDGIGKTLSEIDKIISKPH
ncbi:MAG: hypothetical protein APF77_17250 [Clostridia bacterium BRH_c25]|nr:MAG: hypothetical protein APF77_17250 [Clostridia bacterium BRH_c25]